MTKIRLGIVLLAFATAPMMRAATFAYLGSAFPMGISGAFGPTGSYDATGLQMVDVADGFELTGLLTITLNTVDSITPGYLQVDTGRLFEAPFGTPALLTAHMTGNLSTTGDVVVTGLSANTLLFPTIGSQCVAAVQIGTGQIDSSIAQGAFSASFSGNNINPLNPCTTLGDPNQLNQTFAITFVYTEGGTIALNFGNSVLSEGTAAVPEPSSLTLLGTGITGGWFLRRKRAQVSDRVNRFLL